MARPKKRRWTTLTCPLTFLYDLQYYMGANREPYYRFIERLINNYQKIQKQNAEFWARSMGEQPTQEMMNERIPALPEVRR